MIKAVVLASSFMIFGSACAQQPQCDDKNICWTVSDEIGGQYAFASMQRPSITALADGSRVDVLTNTEYARLEAARKALKDAEEEIAKAHGVNPKGEYYTPKPCPTNVYCLQAIGHDTYRFAGHFILIDVPEEK